MDYCTVFSTLSNSCKGMNSILFGFSFGRFALAQATVEQGKFLLAGKELEKEEKLVEKQKADLSAVRLRKENMSAVVSERRRRAREK